MGRTYRLIKSMQAIVCTKATLCSTLVSRDHEDQCLALLNYLKATQNVVFVLSLPHEKHLQPLPQRLADLNLPVIVCENLSSYLSEKGKQYHKLVLVGDSSEVAEACLMTDTQFIGVSSGNTALATELAQKGLSVYNVVSTFQEVLNYIQHHGNVSTEVRDCRVAIPKSLKLPTYLRTSEKDRILLLQLSAIAKSELPRALELLLQVDCDMLKLLSRSMKTISLLCERFYSALKANRRICVFGCRKSRKLILLLTKLIVSEHPSYRDKIIGMWIGDDNAVPQTGLKVKDNQEVAATHLRVSGWQSTDAIVFVNVCNSAKIIMEMLKLSIESGARPLLLFGNTYSRLKAQYGTEEMFRRPDLKAQIDFVPLLSPPMCIADGYQRQASNVLTLLLGYALLSSIELLAGKTHTPFETLIDSLTRRLTDFNYADLAKIVLAEAHAYDKEAKMSVVKGE